ncbi:carbohydrate kinase [Desulfurivibrio sp. C05AmB]|uniref:carbohydrate kinase family protein n=1 Tax=Desulfurivibrio sp. C05AmB TaxID=3374371 RepID=UPI00376F0CBB
MIVAIGEVVWDIFPDREVLGGAPVNVAYHLAAQGLAVRVITRVGRDGLGDATLARLAQLGLPLAGVQRDEELATGRVRVTFGPDREPRYEIVAPAAWDNIDPAAALATVGDQPYDLVFGTLAQRDSRSRLAIRALAAQALTCFYDVNLRPPFTPRELVLESLALADLVKVNGEELRQLAAWLDLPGLPEDAGEPGSPPGELVISRDQEQLAAAVRERYGLAALVITEGAAGAWVRTASATQAVPGEPVAVADTVGAGDAFFAALIAAYQEKLPWPEILRRANRRGAYVASRPGATPP